MFKKSLGLVVAASSLFVLVSCGGSSSGSSSKRQEQQQETLSSVNWKIFLQGRSFPTKSTVMINDSMLLNECMGKQQYFIDRSTDPQSITIEKYFVPAEGELKISVSDCTDGSIFFAQDNVPFDMIKENNVPEIIVNL